MTEALENSSGSASSEAQCQQPSPGGAHPSPASFYNASLNYNTQYSGSRNLSYGDHIFLDDIPLPDNNATPSTTDYHSSLSALQTPPASSTTNSQTPSTFPCNFPPGLPENFPSNGTNSQTSIIFPCNFPPGLPENFPSNGTNSQPLTRSSSVSLDLLSQHPTVAHDVSANLLDKKTGGWLSPLHIAAQKGLGGIVNLLLQHNVDCNEEDSDCLTPIIHAIIGGHEDVVRSLLLHGARIGNTDGRQRPSALHWAALHRRETLLRALLNHNLTEKSSIDSYDEHGRTPLHVAIDADFEAGVLMLLQFGADPKYKACNHGGNYDLHDQTRMSNAGTEADQDLGR
ncbi:MAG: hypothetical protein Q9171_004619 [Xanthocarpia ochracea]